MHHPTVISHIIAYNVLLVLLQASILINLISVLEFIKVNVWTWFDLKKDHAISITRSWSKFFYNVVYFRIAKKSGNLFQYAENMFSLFFADLKFCSTSIFLNVVYLVE